MGTVLSKKLKGVIIALVSIPVVRALLEAFLNDSNSFEHVIIVVGPILLGLAALLAVLEFVD